MTRTSHQKLERLSKQCNIIPLTTRSRKQFERIHLGDKTKIPYALMSNGGILWNHGSFDEEWSLRKVLRRFIWHDRIHGKAMYRMAVKTFGQDSVPDVFRFEK